MELRDIPDPKIEKTDDIMVKIGAVGVCGSDIHYFTSGRIGEQVVQYPFTVGHECAGTIVEIGSDVTDLQVGDRIAVEPAVTCGRCDQCLAGRENTCRENRFLGCPGQAEGSLSEYLVMPKQNCFKIEDSLSLAEATISEPLAIAIYAVEKSKVRSDHHVGILGMGPIGRTVMLAAQYQGCDKIYCTDQIDARTSAAREAGAIWAGNPSKQDVVRELVEIAPLGLDIVFECCGEQQALDQAVKLLKPGGTLMVIGILETDTMSFCTDSIRRKEITIVNVRRQQGCVQRALDMIAERPTEVSSLITHRYSFENTDAAFDLVADYRDGVVKAMIEFV